MNRSELRYERLNEKSYNEAREILKDDIVSGEDFLRTLTDEPEILIGAYIGDKLAALAQVEKSTDQSFLSVYVAPQFRRLGIGSALISHEEDKLREGGTQKIRSSFHVDLDSSFEFARKHGYNKYFSSAFMQRTGEPFPLELLPIRLYTDNDYLVSQSMYAKAFHEMRIRVGCFPDSVITQPSDEGRRAWKEDVENRFVYEENGEIVAYGHLCGNEISSVSVHTDYQGRGIGKKFVMYLCNIIYQRGNSAVNLWCVVGNFARNLYDNLGFQEKYIAEYPRKTL